MKTKQIIVKTFFAVFILVSVNYLFQQRFFINSFKINAKGQKISVLKIFDNSDYESPINQTTKIKIKNSLCEECGYSLSFYIKTENQSKTEIPLFYSSNVTLGSIFWNVAFMDGKILTSRVEHINPVISGKSINDNLWHHILISTNYNEIKIFIDNNLGINYPVNYLKVPDKWFIYNKENGLSKEIEIRDVTFINKNLSPKEFIKYNNLFEQKFTSFIVYFFWEYIKILLFIFAILILIIFRITKKYKKHTTASVLVYIYPKLFIFLTGITLFWTQAFFTVFIADIYLFLYFLVKIYPLILPLFLRDFFLLPISLIIALSKLLIRRKFKESYQLIIKENHEIYVLIFFILGFILSINRYFFTINLFR